MTDRSLGAAYLLDVVAELRRLKGLADKAIARVTDEELFHAIDPEANSIAIVMKHMAGNMRSRWTAFLTTDGEKPDRDRDSEFEVRETATRESVVARWEAGWRLVFATIEALGPEDLDRTVTIRGEPHSAVKAINRQLSHYAYHVGQIVLLAKHFRSSAWESLSMPRRRPV